MAARIINFRLVILDFGFRIGDLGLNQKSEI